MSRRPVLKVVQVLGAIIALTILAVTVRSAWRELAAEPLTVDGARLAFSLPLLSLSFILFAGLFRLVARELGVPMSYSQAVQLWSFSNLGRYIPGKIWQVIGLAVVARDMGMSPLAMSAVAVVVVSFMVSSGALVGALLLPPGLAEANQASTLALVLIGALLLVPILRPSAVSSLLTRVPGLGDLSITVDRPGMTRLAVLFCALWLVHGVTFFVFLGSFVDLPIGFLPHTSGAYTLANLLGLVAFFAPGGIGIREGVLAHALGSLSVPNLPVHTAAVAARLWSIAGELLVLCVAVVLRVRGR